MATVAGVALAVALVVVVSALAVGLSGPVAGIGGDETYWILPEADGDRSPLVAADDPQFGDAHTTKEIIEDLEDVEAVTPLLLEILQVQTADGDPAYIAVAGIIPTADGSSPIGLETDSMTPGSPYVSDGQWTGEVILSEGAADQLDARTGDELSVVGQEDHDFGVTAVGTQTGDDLFGTTPVAFVHLGELQHVVGAGDADLADQFAVTGADPETLENVYQQADVVSSSELALQQVAESDVAVALGLGGLAVGVIVGVLFLATALTLQIAGDRRRLWSMTALGVGRPARLWLFGGQALVLVGLGGVVGSLLGYVGIYATNAFGSAVMGTGGPVAVAHPIFLVYGVGVAVIIGILTLPILTGVLVHVERMEGEPRG